MASGTADLQRDLGGAIMQSIFGALLTAGYAAAANAAIAGSGRHIPSATQAELTKSFDSAEAIAKQYPQYTNAITSGAKTSFLQGDQWAYVAGIVAVLAGAAIVFFLFPKKEAEEQMLASYHAEDVARAAAESDEGGVAEPAPA
jgi:MFS transporter, DHA2 family, multidrug resistance protein